jgi:hypothetical protein
MLAWLALLSNIIAMHGSRIIAFLIAPFFLTLHLHACTIFCAAGDTVLVANNEDGSVLYPSKMWFVPAGKFGHGRVCFGWFSQAQGGMNDRGLFFDWAALPGQDIPLPKKLSGKLPPDGCVSERVLATCATVDDVVRFCEAIEYVGNPAHFLAVDKSGDSVVGEWIKGVFKPIRGKKKQLITNFFLTDPELGNYPCPRFETVTRMLAESAEISVDRFTAILRAVAASFDGGGTKYSNIYDLGQGQITVYAERQFDHGITIDLAEELRRGFREVDLKDLSAAARLAEAELRKTLDPPQPNGKHKVPAVKELLARFDEARGGRHAVKTIRSLRINGTMSEAWGDGGKFEIVAAPDRRALTFSFSKLGTFRNGYDGKIGWQEEPVVGASVARGAMLTHAQRDAGFFNWQYDAKQYASMESIGAASFDGHDCFALKLVTRSGLGSTHYFDVETGLLRGIFCTTALRSGVTWSRTVYSEYKKFGNLLFPTQIRFNDEGFDVSATVKSVVLNDTDSASFAPPNALRRSAKTRGPEKFSAR